MAGSQKSYDKARRKSVRLALRKALEEHQEEFGSQETLEIVITLLNSVALDSRVALDSSGVFSNIKWLRKYINPNLMLLF